MTYQNDCQEKSQRLVHFPTTQSTIGTQKIAKIIKLVRSDTTLMMENDSDDLPRPPGGKYSIPKRSPGKITKVETLSNHLEYHWDPKNGKNHKIGLL